MIREAIQQVVERENLSAEVAQKVMAEMMEGKATPSQIASFITAMRMKGETEDELRGFVMAMRNGATKVSAPEGAVDLCGTGGDGSNSFNISTTAAFVVAAAGVPVAKHGNRSVSSRCGSADVLAALGIPVDLGQGQVEECLSGSGIGFMFAPVFHESMRNVLAPRREIGLRTFFNILGPMTNPANVRRQLIGIFDPRIARKMAGVLRELGTERAMIVNGDGMDEITTLGKTHIVELGDGGLREYDISPDMFGLDLAEPGDIKGGDAAENARIMLSVLKGERSPRSDIVALNAAAAIYVAGRATSIHESLEIARDILKNGSGMIKLREFSSVARATEAARQRTEDISKLRSRRILPEVLTERSDEIVQTLLREVLARECGAASVAVLDKDLLDSPSILSVIVLGRMLSLTQDSVKQAVPTTRASTSLSKAIMSSDTLSVIAEYKPSSPSSPPLQIPPDPERAARAYSVPGIAGISVLVEPNYFSGSPELFSFFRFRITAPMLFKDFVVSEAQIELASSLGADAILLIAKALNAKSLDVFIRHSLARGLEPLVELHDEQDLAKLSACKDFKSVKLVGINSRDLRSFETDFTKVQGLKSLLPPGRIVIAESGVRSSEDLVSLEGFDAVLIGNLFMRAEGIEAEVARMVSACRSVAK